MKYILNNKGFTLIELMVTVVLIAIVLTIVYNMMTTGNRIFAQGDAKADVQSSLRVSGDFISDKLRYASNVKILDALPADITADTIEYIYEEDGRLKYYDGNTISDVPGVLDGVQTGIYFEDRNSEAVLIRLNATFREQVYEVETAASLLNIGDSILISASGPVIEFVPAIPVNANINARPIETITIRTEPEPILEAPVDGQIDFVADVEPADASQKTVRWEFTNPVDYASIGSTSATTGLLKLEGAVAGDIVNVRAVAMDGSGVVSNVYTITVSEEAPADPGISVTVESAYNRIFQKNGELQMIAKIEPESASSGKAVTWSLNVDDSVATINSEGMLKTVGNNESNGTIVVTATLEGASDSKNIQIIENITGITIEEVKPPSTATKSKYIGKIKCLLLPGNIPATAVNGVASIKWDMVASESSGITGSTLTPNSDGTLSLNVDGQNKHAYFSIRATITPISGVGHTSNLVKIDFDN